MWRMKGTLLEKRMRLTCIPDNGNKSERCEWFTDKDSFNQTRVRQLWALFQWGPILGMSVRAQFSYELSRVSLAVVLCPQYLISDHPQYLINSSSPAIPQVMSDHSGLSSVRILWGQFGQNLLLPMMFPLRNFYTMTPAKFLGCRCPLTHVIFEIEPVYNEVSFPLWQLFLSKICFYSFNFCPALVFLWHCQTGWAMPSNKQCWLQGLKTTRFIYYLC